MLIRIRGGTGGIKDYLEEGHKQGMELSRDERDERIVLAGDLDVADQIIQTMDGKGELYIHGTFAFKEDHVDRLEEMAKDIEEFIFSAYDKDEYCMYMEAHIPRVKSYTNQKTGEFVECKPHIHCLIVKKNLLTGQALDPFGLVKNSERHIDAFQESFNNKYGLASPKENRRIEFTDASEMISRYKGDTFEGQNKALRGDILETMLSKNIEKYEDFTALLAERGNVITRNAGKPNEYLNITPAGAGKGVNLKDYVFSREFVELPAAEKQRHLAAEVQRKYEVAGEARRDPAYLTQQLQDWHQTRAKEVKYLNSGDRKTYQAYRQATPEQRQQMLAEREQRFYEKHRKDTSHEQENRSRTDRAAGADRFGRDYGFKQPAGTERAAGPERAAGNRQFGLEPFGQGTPPQSLNSVRTLSGVGVVSFAKGAEVLLPDHAPGKLEHQRAEPADGLRRPADRHAAVKPTGRQADNVVSQLARDQREARQARSAGRQSDIQEAKHKLDARRLLAELSQSHGVIPEKYEVTKAKDGSDRIKCGARNLNVSDFLTKELSMPWKDAEKTLRESYGRQTGRQLQRDHRQEPRRQLWAEFQAGRGERQQLRTRQWSDLRTTNTERLAAIRREFDAKKSKIQRDPSLTVAQRRAATSVARMDKLMKEAAQRATYKAESAKLTAAQRVPATAQYRDFLADKAQAGDEHALAELRRMKPEQAEKARDTDAQVTAAEPTREKQDREPIHRAPAITYQVHNNGDVTYQRAGKDMLRDQGKAVHMLQSDNQTIETGLRLAQQKFGSKLALSGPQDFQEKAARIAAEAGLKVEFTDQRLNKIMRDRSAELAADKAREQEARRLGQEFAKQRETASKGEGAAKTPAPRQAPEKATEQDVQLAIKNSKPPYTENGRYSGPVRAVDGEFVYQSHGRDTIRHERKHFSEAPKTGDQVQVTYNQGRATVKNQAQEQAKRQDLDKGHGL
ncbi:LPD7 domain-containing protein [Duganella callida]|uniref:Uncharacterized protein n=1 Tax=Duganella callida TaxID=2561932 RepID=A0A4Y9SUN6_9BURK|nr:LPD7 domain-containing protein [Duganella callida]TFW28466.1 hypothetical protein E4L98_05610 [Duganella callida]